MAKKLEVNGDPSHLELNITLSGRIKYRWTGGDRRMLHIANKDELEYLAVRAKGLHDLGKLEMELSENWIRTNGAAAKKAAK